jgi:hypothetical protein
MGVGPYRSMPPRRGGADIHIDHERFEAGKAVVGQMDKVHLRRVRDGNLFNLGESLARRSAFKLDNLFFWGRKQVPEFRGRFF